MSRPTVCGGGRHTFVLAVLAVFLILLPHPAEPQYALSRGVLGNGAVDQSDATHRVVGTLGQSLIGLTSDASYDAKIGFWYVVLHDIATGVEEGVTVPGVYRLDQNRPNPFNPTTTIPFALPEACRVTLRVYDVTGREVVTLVDRELPAGEHSVILQPDRMASGVYFYRIQAGAFTQSRRMVLVR